jgi:D-lactate dehydrogenase
LEIKSTIEADPQLVAKIKRKYSIKNTTGYHMEGFVDGSTPLKIFRKLLVGSEGTLGFISEAVFQTVPDDRFQIAVFLLFEDMHSACAAVAPFMNLGAAAVELCGRECLRVVDGKPRVPNRWKTLPDRSTALLIEFQQPTLGDHEKVQERADVLVKELFLLEEAVFTSDPELIEQYWAVRHGLLASIGGARAGGTSLLLEDVCSPRGAC